MSKPQPDRYLSANDLLERLRALRGHPDIETDWRQGFDAAVAAVEEARTSPDLSYDVEPSPVNVMRVEGPDVTREFPVVPRPSGSNGRDGFFEQSSGALRVVSDNKVALFAAGCWSSITEGVTDARPEVTARLTPEAAEALGRIAHKTIDREAELLCKVIVLLDRALTEQNVVEIERYPWGAAAQLVLLDYEARQDLYAIYDRNGSPQGDRRAEQIILTALKAYAHPEPEVGTEDIPDKR